MKKIVVYLAYVFYTAVAKHLPVSYHMFGIIGKKLRRGSAKLFIKKMGSNVNIEKGASFGRRLQIDDNSGIGIDCLIDGEVIIGKNVMMGPECIIYTQNHEFNDLNTPMCKQGFQRERTVIIEDDVWIGARVIILPGVKIGCGCIIGAGSVVSKSMPNYSVICGNPAKIVKKRGECVVM